ncbi:MAG TPA: hypothetical protein PK420_03275 [Rubrivivax sp.]|nr:hypothetical protein [Betaproteobacteria bacterium]HRC37070.1 hypothetical protein [Rubrivivax sp.]MBK7275460.1 hypothetical protein [Betaproteobacteria bacterium]MBK7458957.1 hypothetical protein [Betaproteobacteria bacterium]MBK7514646.1 hypothetical protein [Betaproteobacteria bacterium]
MYLPRPNEWSEGFKGGTLATQSSIAWLAGHLSHWLAPDTAGRRRAARGTSTRTFDATGRLMS